MPSKSVSMIGLFQVINQAVINLGSGSPEPVCLPNAIKKLCQLYDYLHLKKKKKVCASLDLCLNEQLLPARNPNVCELKLLLELVYISSCKLSIAKGLFI